MVKAHDTNKLPPKPLYVMVSAWRQTINLITDPLPSPEYSLFPRTQVLRKCLRKNSYTQRISKARGGKSISIWIKSKIQKAGQSPYFGEDDYSEAQELSSELSQKTSQSFEMASLCWFYSTVKHLLTSLFFMMYTPHSIDSPKKFAPNYNLAKLAISSFEIWRMIGVHLSKIIIYQNQTKMSQTKKTTGQYHWWM